MKLTKHKKLYAELVWAKNRANVLIRKCNESGMEIPEELQTLHDALIEKYRVDATIEGVRELLDAWKAFDNDQTISKARGRSSGEAGATEAQYLWKMSTEAKEKVVQASAAKGMSQNNWIRLELRKAIKVQSVTLVDIFAEWDSKKVVKLSRDDMDAVDALAAHLGITKRHLFESVVLNAK